MCWGFFAADGYITVNKRGGQFWCIQIRDRDLLENIKETIGAEHKISIRIPKKFNENKMYRLQIGSIKMCNDLRKRGFSERKTKNLTAPIIPNRFFNHFVRGYFDGDGYVWVGYVHKERKTNTLVIFSGFTSCSKKFLDDMRLRLRDNNVPNGVLSKGKGNYYRLMFSVRGSLKLYDFMYNSLSTSKLFLDRKKQRFEKYLRSIDNAAVV